MDKIHPIPRNRTLFGAAPCLILLLACGACGSDTPQPLDPHPPMPPMPEGRQVTVEILPDTAAGEMEARYLGFALDTAQITNGLFWSPDPSRPAIAETPDLESPKLRKLVSYLAPSRFRVGGTACDGVYFCPEEGVCTLPPAFEDAYRGDDHIPTALTHEKVRLVADFAEAVDARVMFCVAMGPGPRDPATGAWQPDNARRLIRFAASLPNRDRFEIWESGNEVNFLDLLMKMPAPLTTERYVEDLRTFRALVDEEDPGKEVAAPSCYFLPFPFLGDLGFTERMAREGLHLVDRISWHLYATQSVRCPLAPFPADPETLFSRAVEDNSRAMARYVREAAAGRVPVMNGECASAQCGGQAGLSDTMIDALWYADWIGLNVEEGSSALVRQTLVGTDYGMLDMISFDPRPTFLVNVMYRRTVERFRLATEADRAEIRAHGYCNPAGATAVTAVLSNPTAEPLVASLSLPSRDVVAAVQWTVSTEGGPASSRAAINGEQPLPDGTIPAPAGTPVHLRDGKAFSRVDPYAVVFTVLSLGEPAPACR